MLYNAEKQCINVDQRRFHGNKPSVRQVAFTVQQGELSVTAGTKLKGDYTRLSGGGNGDVRFHNITPVQLRKANVGYWEKVITVADALVTLGIPTIIDDPNALVSASESMPQKRSLNARNAFFKDLQVG